MQPLTKKEFWSKYWFSPLQMVTLVNPRKDDYPFMVELRRFVIKAGAKEELPGTVANVYLNEMTRILAQDDDKLEYLSDFNLMKQYFDKLIVGVKDLAPQVNNTPAYLQDMPDHMSVQSDPETPPWQLPVKTVEPAPVAKSEPGEKSFEYNGLVFKAVTDESGDTKFYKNNKEIKEADYAKAASLV